MSHQDRKSKTRIVVNLRHCRRREPRRVAAYTIERGGLFAQAEEGSEKGQEKSRKEAEPPWRKRRQANKKQKSSIFLETPLDLSTASQCRLYETHEFCFDERYENG